VALDAALVALRECRTAQQLDDRVASLAVEACAAAATMIGHVVGSRWLPWLRAGDLRLLERLDAVPASPLAVSALPSVDQRVLRTGEPATRRATAAGRIDLVVAAVMSAGSGRGLLYAAGSSLNQEIVACYASALGAVIDVIRARQDAQRQHDVVALLCGGLAEPAERPIELISDEPEWDIGRGAVPYTRSTAMGLRTLLTDRQREVLALMMTGLTNAEIAEHLMVALPTVKSHVRALLRISRSANRAEALARFSQDP
jgi:DNA-binding CsgD family transcriptional regulator